MGFRDGPKVTPHSLRSPFLGLGWPEKAPFAWAAAFAFAFVAAYEVNSWIDPWVSVVDSRVSLVFLPAFFRVVAVLVAGLAGALGLMLGALVIGLSNGDPFLAALPQAFFSALAPCLAVYLLRIALKRSVLPFDMATLLLLAALTSIFSAALHGLFWAEFEPDTLVWGVDTVTLMMVGDLVGVILGFLTLRVMLRILKATRLQDRV
jgi:hypothetical protein